jgi:hypothetical protein
MCAAIFTPYISGLFMLLSAFLAYVDAIEVVPSGEIAAICSLLSTLGHIPGFIAALFFRKSKGVVGVAAFCLISAVGVMGCFAYGAYAMTEGTENPNSAAHMHIFMFPVVYVVFACLVIGAGSVLLFVAGPARAIGFGRDDEYLTDR